RLDGGGQALHGGDAGDRAGDGGGPDLVPVQPSAMPGAPGAPPAPRENRWTPGEDCPNLARMYFQQIYG
ncbi:hypothetical protein ACFW3L_11520, partial [Nocardiopsis sp. NPDC058789]